MQFEKDYFSNRKYSRKEEMVKRNVLEVMHWASAATHDDLLIGQGKRALDIGCAYGYTSEVLANLDYETLGVDVSNWGINQAKNGRNVSFLVCDAQTSIPFKNATFDLVTCFDVLEHLSYPEKALEGMLAVCRGTVVCTTPNKVEKPVRKIMLDYDETHINVKSPSEWQKCIPANSNYTMLSVETFHDFAINLAGKLFFKSFRVPKYGLTVRIVIKK